MSIINQMLKDLNKRKNSTNAQNQDPTAGLQTTSYASHTHTKYLLALLIGVVVVAAIYLWFSPEKQKTAAINTANVSTPLSSSKMMKAIHPQPIAITLQSITYSKAATNEDEQTRHIVANFHFNKAPTYNLNKDINNHMLTLHFQKTSIAETLNLNEQDPIEQMTVEQEGENTAANFQLSDNISDISIDQDETTINITFVEAILAPEDIAPVITVSPEQQRQANYQSALHLATQDQSQAAILALEKLITQAPDFKSARTTLATLYIRNHTSAKALTVLEDGLAFSPNYPEFITLKARIILNDDEPNAALAVLQTISPDLKKYPHYYATLAAVEQRLGHYVYASKLYQQLIFTYPSKGVWWLGLAIAQEASSQNNAAIQSFKRAVATKTLKPNLIAFAQTQINTLGS